MRIGNMELTIIAANPAELKELGLNYWLSVEPGYLGSIGRLIICGWGVELYRD